MCRWTAYAFSVRHCLTITTLQVIFYFPYIQIVLSFKWPQPNWTFVHFSDRTFIFTYCTLFHKNHFLLLFRNKFVPELHLFGTNLVWWSRKVLLLIMIFMLLLLNNVVQKTRTQVTNTISLYKLAKALLLFICFKIVMKSMKIC